MKQYIQTIDWNLNKLAPVSVYADHRIAIVEGCLVEQIFAHEAIRMNALVVMLCVQGNARMQINNNVRELHTGDLLIYQPYLIVENADHSADFKMQALLLEKEYIDRLEFLAENTWNARVFLQDHPIVSLNADELASFRYFYTLLRDRLTGVQRKYQKEIIDALIQVFFYEFIEIIERFVQASPTPKNSATTLFQSFVKLLESEYPKPRTVAYYADKLFITPKYLSAVVKNISGGTASQLINQAVMTDINFLLKRSRKSIKEIAHELGFPNLSFFGKYVKRYSGLSPKQLREQKNGNK